jgi:hypothetical protein
MRLIKVCVLWIFIVACFAGFGYFVSESRTQPDVDESMLAFTGIGFSTASYVIIGIWLIKRVQSHGLKKIWAVPLLFLTSLFAMAPPFLVIWFAAYATWPVDAARPDLFAGEHGWQFLITFYYMFCISLGAFIFFVTYVLLTRPLAQNDSNHRDPNSAS